MTSTPNAPAVPNWLRALFLQAAISAILCSTVVIIDLFGPVERPLAHYRVEDWFTLALSAALIYPYLDLRRRLSKKVGQNRLGHAIILGVAGLILGWS